MIVSSTSSSVCKASINALIAPIETPVTTSYFCPLLRRPISAPACNGPISVASESEIPKHLGGLVRGSSATSGV